VTQQGCRAWRRSRPQRITIGAIALLFATIYPALLVLAGFEPAYAQNQEGQLLAAQYGAWKIHGITPNTYSFVVSACTQQAGKQSFSPLATNAPIKIIDANPAETETVTPSVVTNTPQSCAVTIAPANPHSSFDLTSATGGLQEALNANLTAPAGNNILLTAQWYAQGGTTGIISTVHGAANLGIVDVTVTPYVFYSWNGTQYVVDPLGGGIPAPYYHNQVADDGTGVIVHVPEKGTATASGTTTVAWDEDVLNGRFDCRNPAYAGGCLGGTPGLAMQAFANRLICYQAESGKHAYTELPPGVIAVGTPANPTLYLPSGANYIGRGGYFGNRTIFQATYNNRTAVYVGNDLTPTSPCADGTSPEDTSTGGSRDGFSVNGCDTGGCSNVPGDTGNYPLGGPNQVGLILADAQGREGPAAGLYATHNGSDGIICAGLDNHCDNLGGGQNLYYFYYGMDQAGQNYSFSQGECHGEVTLGGLDNQYAGHFETYGTFMVPGAEYRHVAGVCWASGLSTISNVFAQIEETAIIHYNGGSVQSTATGLRLDGSRGTGLMELSAGNTTWVGANIDGDCNQNPATDYLVFGVTTTTPGSGQTPGTYLLTASSGNGQISVVVGSGGTVTASPTITVHGRGYASSANPTFTLAAGGTPATFTVQMEPYTFENDGGFGGISPCDAIYEQSGGHNVFIGGSIENATSTFPGTYATGDIFAQQPNRWVGVGGSLATGAIVWDSNIAEIGPGEGQTVIDPEPSVLAGTNNSNVTGSVINVGVNGSYVSLVNTTARNGQELEIIGDGFTTMPYEASGLPNPPSGSTTFGSLFCGGSTSNLLLAANTLYNFKITGGQIYGLPAVLMQHC
jgi:hypothetical protein